MIFAVITWLAIASTRCINGTNPDDFPGCETGDLNINTTGNLFAQLGGNLVAICLSGIVCSLVSFAEFKFGSAKKFDWEVMRVGITRVEKVEDAIPEEEMTPEFLEEAGKWISKWGVGLSLFLILIWPLLTITWGVFDKSLYAIWASVAFVWGYAGAFIIIFLPLWESKDTIIAVLTCKKAETAKAETAVA